MDEHSWDAASSNTDKLVMMIPLLSIDISSIQLPDELSDLVYRLGLSALQLLVLLQNPLVVDISGIPMENQS